MIKFLIKHAWWILLIIGLIGMFFTNSIIVMISRLLLLSGCTIYGVKIIDWIENKKFWKKMELRIKPINSYFCPQFKENGKWITFQKEYYDDISGMSYLEPICYNNFDEAKKFIDERKKAINFNIAPVERLRNKLTPFLNLVSILSIDGIGGVAGNQKLLDIINKEIEKCKELTPEVLQHLKEIEDV